MLRFFKKNSLLQEIKQELYNSGLSTQNVEWLFLADNEGNKISDVANNFKNLSQKEKALAGACLLLTKFVIIYIQGVASPALKSHDHTQLSKSEEDLVATGTMIKDFQDYLKEIYITPALRQTNLIQNLDVAYEDCIEAGSKVRIMRLALENLANNK